MKNLLLFLLACSLGAAAAARPIRGSVKCGGKPMGGVTVTDGYTFAQSDEQGIFTLDADDQALFISLVTPSGYLAPLDGGIPQFYRAYDPAAKRYDFELQPWPGSGECYELLAIADPQPKTEEHFRRLRSEVMPALQAATDNGRTRGSNQAAIVLGDIVWDSPELFAGVKAEFAGLGVPVYGVIGNHDHDLNKYTDREATENYRRHFGPTYYAFDMGRTHYIVLDDIVYHGAKKYEEQIDTMQLRWAAAYAERLPAGSRKYNRRFDDRQLAWLKEELTHVDKSTPIVVGCHCPLYSYSGSGGVSVALQTQADIDKILSCFAGFSNVTFVTGHTHVNRNIQSPTYANVYEQNIAAVCGTWWWTQQYGNNNVCTDGSPAGYKIFTVDGTDLKWQYKATGLPIEKQFITYDMNEVKEYWATDATALKAFAAGNDMRNRDKDYSTVGENAVYINVWAYEPGWTVTVTENGTPLDVKQVWSKKDPLHSISYDIPRGAANNGTLTFPSTSCMHMFEVTASSASSTLEISVTDRFGNVSTESMTRPKALTTDVTK